MDYGVSGAASSSLGTEVERLRTVIGRQFEIYDIRVTYDAIVFFVDCSPSTLEANFDSVRTALVPQNYIPFLQKRGGEYTITISKRKPLGKKGNLVNIILLAVTLVTTTVTGAILWAGYFRISNLFTLSNFLNGIVYFVVPLMLILGLHEMGHFVVARRFGVNASLPFFLPSIPPFGTFGAFISIRDPFPNRKALLEIGIAGPIVGFLVTIPVAIAGLYLTKLNPVAPLPLTPNTTVYLAPYLYQVLLSLFQFPSDASLFPTAFAAWVGFFVTAMNLLPAGQLDGGHVSRALLGDYSKYLGWAAILAMVLLGFVSDIWIFYAILALFMGVRHPPPLNDISRLKVDRKMLGAVAMAMFLVSVTPIPVTTIPTSSSFSMSASPSSILILNTSPVQYLNLTVENTGNIQESVNITQVQTNGFVATFGSLGSGPPFLPSVVLDIGVGANATVLVKVAAVSGTTPGSYILNIQGISDKISNTLKVDVTYS